MAIVSLGARGNPVAYKFTAFAPFTILSQGPGYWGADRFRRRPTLH